MMLSLETRRGNADRAVQIEKQLADFGPRDALTQSTSLHPVRRIAMPGPAAMRMRIDCSEASSIGKFIPDRALVRSSYALTLALDGRSKESGACRRDDARAH